MFKLCTYTVMLLACVMDEMELIYVTSGERIDPLVSLQWTISDAVNTVKYS